MMNTTTDQSLSFDISKFYIVETEPGHTDFDLPVWTCKHPGGNGIIGNTNSTVEKIDLPNVPGAFQLLNVVNDQECNRLVQISENLGYHDDAPVSLPRSIRHNKNFNWIVDESVDGPIWNRCKEYFEPSSFSGMKPLGLNARFRFYQYSKGDFFDFHTDGAWPGSRVVNGQVLTDAYGDRISEMTFLIFLTDGYEGGRTLFQNRQIGQAEQIDIATISTPKGAALCFPHGMHPQHCIHSGEKIKSGQKYVIRTDVLYG